MTTPGRTRRSPDPPHLPPLQVSDAPYAARPWRPGTRRWPARRRIERAGFVAVHSREAFGVVRPLIGLSSARR